MTLTEYQIVESTSSASTVASYTAAPSTTYPSEILGVSISISSQPDSFSYDVIYYLDSYTNLSVAESSFLSLPVDLTCSIDGTTSITYSLVQIGNSQVPSWVSLSSTSSSLVMTTPDVSTNTNFTFGVQATVSGYNYIKNILIQVVDSTPITQSTSTQAKSSTRTPQIVSILSLGATVVASIVGILGLFLTITSNSSTSMVWSLINLYQMMLLLPLIGAFIHSYVVDFIEGVQFSILSFSLPQNKQRIIEEELSYFECKQDNQYLNDIGVEHCSTLMNISSSITVDLMILLLHIICVLLYLCLRHHQDCLLKFFVWLLKVLSFSAYIRKFIESFLLLSISSTQELHKGKLTYASEIISYLFSLFVLIFLCCSSILLMICHPKSMNNDFAIKRLWVKEFYEGFKMNHSGKLYFFIFTSRRIILTSWIFFGESLPKMIRICLFCVLQFPSLPYIAIFRPYSETKENVCETLNEIVYTVFCIFLCFKNSESEWTSTMAYIIIWVITINSLFIMIILIFCVIKFLFFSPKSPLHCYKRKSHPPDPKITPK